MYSAIYMSVYTCGRSCTIYMYSPHSIIYTSAVIHMQTYTYLYIYAVTVVIQALETLKHDKIPRAGNAADSTKLLTH